MCEVISTEGGRSNLDEALGILRSPSLGCLTILTELVLDEVVRRVNANCLEAERTEEELYLTGHVTL